VSNKDLPKRDVDVKENAWLTSLGRLATVGLALSRVFEVGGQLIQAIKQAAR
jgi:hypothetical protein